MLRLGIIASSISKGIVDLFNRITSGSLGTATSGQVWGATRGVWFANGTQAQSDNAASTYPIASIPLAQDATMKVDTSGGCGLAFWVTDAGSWWGAYPLYESSSVVNCTGPDSYCYSEGCTPANSCGTINQTTSSSCSGPIAYCYSAGCTPPNGCGAISETTSSSCTGPTVSCSDTTNTCNPGGCGTISFTSVVVGGGTFADDSPCSMSGGTSTQCYNCGLSGTIGPNCGPAPDFYCCTYPSYTQYTRTQNTTVTTYTRSSATNVTSYTRWSATNVGTTTFTTSMRVISSVSGTVATDSTTVLATSTSSRPIVASMDVKTSGNTITVKGYSGVGQTTQLGSTITRTPVSPTRGTGVGIIKAPTTEVQGSTLDNYSASN